jgi:hypothetical protein
MIATMGSHGGHLSFKDCIEVVKKCHPCLRTSHLLLKKVVDFIATQLHLGESTHYRGHRLLC